MSITWTNWSRNQTARPELFAAPASEDEVTGALAAGSGRDLTVRVVGGSHSFSPLVETDGILLDLRNLTGVTAVDHERGVATVRAGTSIAELGRQLFDQGCALPNMGDIDQQTIAGAIATGTHGSGVAYHGIADGIQRLRIALADGRIIEIGPGDRDALFAARVSLGLLGVVMELDIEVVDAYWLEQRSWVASFEETLEQWSELADSHRHASFYWMPNALAPALFEIDAWGLDAGADDCVIRTFDEVPREAATPTDLLPGRQRGPAHEVFPEVYDLAVETELFVPSELGAAALRGLTKAFRANPTLTEFPVLVRSVRADKAWLSPAHGRDSIAISVCGDHRTEDYWRAFRVADAVLDDYESRPHWGKIHMFDAARLRARQPRLAEFLEVRSAYDPDGRFVTPYLDELLGIG